MTEKPASSPRAGHPALIAMDMDGTVAGLDHVPSPYTEQVLQQLTPLGIRGVIVTGRSERSALGTSRSAGLSGPVISANGAMVTDPGTGERLWLKQFTPEAVVHTVAVAKELGTNPLVWTPDTWYIEKTGHDTDVLTDILEQQPTLCSFDEVLDGLSVVKIMLGGAPELLDQIGPELEERVPGMTRSMAQYYESAPPNSTKAEALLFVLDLLDIAPDQVWGFADGGNDVGWFSLVQGRRLAMANAMTEVKTLATEIIGHHAEDGVARYLVEHLGL
ncbi:MAG: HAD hydrolase family protein [Brooklawnia sp.]|jgi:Cof subfamily protein (haloacid dehalogenase superfamily)